MRAVLLSVVTAFVLLEPVMADPSDLEGGVFIAHYPAAMQFSSDPPAGGWCQQYLSNYAITSCEEQVNRLDSYDEVTCQQGPARLTPPNTSATTRYPREPHHRGMLLATGNRCRSRDFHAFHGTCYPERCDGSAQVSRGVP
jgi:hypothetical protein